MLHNGMSLSTISREKESGMSRSNNSWLPEYHSFQKNPNHNSKSIANSSKLKQPINLKQNHVDVSSPNRMLKRFDTSRKSEGRSDKNRNLSKKKPSSFELNSEAPNSK